MATRSQVILPVRKNCLQHRENRGYCNELSGRATVPVSGKLKRIISTPITARVTVILRREAEDGIGSLMIDNVKKFPSLVEG